MSRALTPLAALALALFAVMSGYIWFRVVPEAGGQLPFDFRYLGYDLKAVREYLEALSGTGRAVYLLEVRWLDTAFAVVLGLLLAGGAWALCAGLAVWRKLLACVPAAAFAGLDLMENALVAELLRAGPVRYSADMAGLASDVTVFKFVFLVSALTVVLGIWKVRRTA